MSDKGEDGEGERVFAKEAQDEDARGGVAIPASWLGDWRIPIYHDPLREGQLFITRRGAVGKGVSPSNKKWHRKIKIEARSILGQSLRLRCQAPKDSGLKKTLFSCVAD
ncbi:hypothetical protein JTE90_010994 [Oedothorax gibbosus]|uniref:Uncharacterized protein n=1 Tax=Oedothorax gibbosus TaxID=931172 RepID=A0AAV6VCN0_9ARAC|nr:hypothetical protein JTE90_010994 [Oedothorax gibbosus]